MPSRSTRWSFNLRRRGCLRGAGVILSGVLALNLAALNPVWGAGAAGSYTVVPAQNAPPVDNESDVVVVPWSNAGSGSGAAQIAGQDSSAEDRVFEQITRDAAVERCLPGNPCDLGLEPGSVGPSLNPLPILGGRREVIDMEAPAAD